MKRILIAALVLCVSLCPMGALAAESAMVTGVHLDGITVALNGGKPIEVGLKLDLRYGQAKGKMLLDANLTGNSDVLNYQIALEKDSYKLLMSGLSNYYTVTPRILDNNLRRGKVDMTPMTPFDPAQLMEVVIAFQTMLGEQRSPDYIKMPPDTAGTLKKIGVEGESKQDEIQLFGETVEMSRISATLDQKQCGKFFETENAKSPLANHFLDLADAFMNKYWPVEGASRKIASDTMDIMAWSDEAGNDSYTWSQRATSYEKDDKTEQETSIATSSQRIGEHDAKIQQTSKLIGESGEISNGTTAVDYTEDDGRIKLDYQMDMTGYGVESKDGFDELRYGFKVTYEDKDKHNSRTDLTMNYDVDGRFGKTQMLLTLGVDTSAAEDGITNNKVTLGILMSSVDSLGKRDDVLDLTMGFDAAVSREKMPKKLIDVADKKKVNLGTLNEEQAKKLYDELGVQSIITMGALMATPGVAQLMSEASAAFDRALEEGLTDGFVMPPQSSI